MTTREASFDIATLRTLADSAKADGSWWDATELGEALANINGSVEEFDAAEFIAAVDPQTVLALLDEIKRLRSEAGVYEQELIERDREIEELDAEIANLHLEWIE